MLWASLVLAFTVSSEPLVTADLGGEKLLDELQRRAVLFFWNESHPETGFTKDRAANFAASDAFDVSSCASTGFALAAYPIGVERKWLPREEALIRTRKTFRNLLTRHDHYRGWFAHWVKWDTGARAWNCEFSTIDTSILLAGAIVAERYWKDAEISRDLQAILDRVDWKAAKTDGGARPDEVFIGHGYRPESSGWLGNRWSNYSEEKMLYIQAYGANPEWPTYGWDRMTREVLRYRDVDIIRGGPLFIHQMAESFYPFSQMRDRLGFNYWIASRNAAIANRLYAIDNPKNFTGYGAEYWGLSASDSPDGYRAFGAPGWIDDNGTITPTAAIAAYYWVPELATQFTDSFYKNHRDAWGRYGFSNAVNRHRNWIGPDVIGIDLGMMLLNVENRRSGLIHRLSMAHPLVKRGYERVGLKVVKDANSGPLVLPKRGG